MMQSLVFKRSEYFICMAMINSISTYNRNCAEPGGGGGGSVGRCLQGNLWYSLSASMTSRLASVTFKMASKETDKNFDFSKEILFISWIWRF